jgi:predicted enzyme related to lactoylglutathione lyase
MPEARPHASTRDAHYVFSKVVVHRLDAMARFYEEVFGLVPFNRHEDEMFGRKIVEVSYLSTLPGGGALTLIQYLDSKAPQAGESIQGFTTTDIEALVARARAAGGEIPEPIRRIDEFGLRVVFVLDPEGHVNEVVQLDA